MPTATQPPPSGEPRYDEHYFSSRYGNADSDWTIYALERSSKRRLAFLAGAPAPVRYLDAGCGQGRYLRLMHRRADTVAGVDVSAYALGLCRQAGLAVAQSDVRQLPFRVGAFSAISCLDVLEHLTIDDALATLAELHRCLVPGGRLLAVVPNWHHRIIKDEFFGDYTHRTIFTRGSIANAARSVGFDAEAREETTLTGVPGIGILAHRFGQPDLAYRLAYTYALLTRRRLQLVLYARRPA